MALTDNLACWHEMGEATGTGNRLDSHGTNHLVPNASVSQTTGKVGNAVTFSGSNYLAKTTNAGLETGNVDFSWVGWIYVPSGLADGRYRVLGKWDAGSFDGEWHLFYENQFGVTALGWLLGGTLFSIFSGNSDVTLDAWNFAALRHDAANDLIRLQVNAATATPVATTGGFPAVLTGDLRYGYVYTPVDSGFGVDQAGYWPTRHLSDAELTSLYNGGAGVAYADLSGGGGGSSIAAIQRAYRTRRAS